MKQQPQTLSRSAYAAGDGSDQRLLNNAIQPGSFGDDQQPISKTVVKGYENMRNPLLDSDRNMAKEKEWKPAINISYETLVLTQSKKNDKLRPAGFRPNGDYRQIKNTSMMSIIQQRCKIRQQNPKLAVCITMYNEDVEELKNTLTGCLHNYNCLKIDPKTNFTKDDFLVCVIVDGYENLKPQFKQLARDKGFLDEEVLFQKGFMNTDRDGNFKMKQMRDVMDEGMPEADIPTNLLHCFQCTTWDFGIQDKILQGRRINFMFCIKQRNDGKINSHKWFFQGPCKYLKPKYTLMLDIGTRPDNYALQKLYNFMENHDQAGGVCGEIEVDIQKDQSFTSRCVQAAQYYEYKLGHTPDKACESFFGFTSVLPGAYSLFRWKAIKGTPLDTFFKNVTSTETPTCAEANEYLAEDRIMCLQVYIKEYTGYTVQYIPDAKAFTDGPLNLTVLMKQRRRWMNGSLFGTWNIIANVGNMVSCGRNDHPFIRQFLLLFFMIYLITLFLLQFITVGAMFVTIVIFYDQFFKTLFVDTGDNQTLIDIYDNGVLKNIIFGVYLGTLFLSVFVSISLPIDRAMGYFKLVSIILGFLMLSTIVGISVFLAKTGFEPAATVCVEDPAFPDVNCVYRPQPDGETYFSLLCVAGIIMLSMYILPMVLRPLDFLQNYQKYMLGFMSYMLLMPVFTNVFQIYAMCNLHDVSWGNRPASTGQEAFTANKKKQMSAEGDYKLYRTNFVLFWLSCNTGYFILINELVGGVGPAAQIGDTITSDSGYLTYFSLYLTGLVIFRVTFALIYIFKWKCRYNCSDKYKVKQRNLNEEVKKIRKMTENGESTDDEDIKAELEKIYDANQDAISRKMDETMIEGVQDVDKHGATLMFLNRKTVHGAAERADSDPDYDFAEFGDAEVEEAEDRIYSEYKNAQRDGNVVNEDVLSKLAGNVPLEAMDQSIVMSARNGIFSAQNGLHLKKDVSHSLLDLSTNLMHSTKKTKMQEMMEATAQSQNPQKGRFGQLLAGLKAEDHKMTMDMNELDTGNNDLTNSKRSAETIEHAKDVLRKNSGAENPVRNSRNTKVSTEQLMPIQEDDSMEQSNFVTSGELEPTSNAPSANSGGLAGIFAQTAREQQVQKRGF